MKVLTAAASKELGIETIGRMILYLPGWNNDYFHTSHSRCSSWKLQLVIIVLYVDINRHLLPQQVIPDRQQELPQHDALDPQQCEPA
jgi:hypothetical protein